MPSQEKGGSPEIIRVPWWESFHQPFAVREHERLSEVEKAFIEEQSTHLAEATLGWAVSAAKTLAPGKSGGYESCVLAGESPIWSDVLTALNEDLPPVLRRCLDPDQVSLGFNSVVMLKNPRNPQEVLIRAQLKNPIGSVPSDLNRVTRSDHTLLLRDGAFTGKERMANTLRVFPFILKAAALKVDPTKARYFDGSLAGVREHQLGNENRIVGLFPDFGACLTFSDSANRSVPPEVIKGDATALARYFSGSSSEAGGKILSSVLLG